VWGLVELLRARPRTVNDIGDRLQLAAKQLDISTARPSRSVPGGIFVGFPRPTAWRCASPPGYPQHDVSFAAAVAGSGAEQQPHPAPPVDFTSASRAQQASVPVGAGPPQHPGIASFFRVAGASGPDASGVVWV
jgi:hypothetical protein